MRLPPPIASRTNARVKALRAALGGEARKPGDLLGLEGPNLIREAQGAAVTFDALYLRAGSEGILEQQPWLQQLQPKHWVVLEKDVFDGTVTTRTPQGIAATCVLPELPLPASPTNTLVLEQIQDPGNFGTLLRSAEAFGVPRVMVTPGTANQWSPKVLRAGAGAALRTAVQRGSIEALLQQLRSEGIRIFAAVAHFTDPLEMAAPHGVLTGRQRNREAPAGTRYKLPAMEGGASASLSYDTDFEHPCALLIGNEGTGLSDVALRLADEQVMIPGGGGSESLNAAIAGAILMYESMRQIPLRLWARKQGLRP